MDKNHTIPRPRLEEIATKFKDALFEACGSEAWDYINDTDMDLTPEEMKWLGIEPLKEDWNYE